MYDKHLKIIWPKEMEKGQWEPIMCNKVLVSLSNKRKKKTKQSPYKFHNRRALVTLDCAAGRTQLTPFTPD